MRRRVSGLRCVVLGAALTFSASSAGAQTPAKPAPPAAPVQAPVANKAPQPAPAAAADPNAPATGLPQPENYTYNADGRRDPFISLIGNTGNTDGRIAVRGEGTSVLNVNEISVRGILQSRGALVAMVEGPNKKTYIVHQGDKLLDGVIKTITPQGLVVIQEVNDPLSLVKQREVSKLLRSLEGGK